MKLYFFDTNCILRLLLSDNESQLKKVKDYIKKAKDGEIKIAILTEIFIEVEYALRKFYKLDRKKITEYLFIITKTSFIEVENRFMYAEILDIYQNTKIDLVDIILFVKAVHSKAEVLSFDKDFEKLKKIYKKGTSTV